MENSVPGSKCDSIQSATIPATIACNWWDGCAFIVEFMERDFPLQPIRNVFYNYSSILHFVDDIKSIK